MRTLFTLLIACCLTVTAHAQNVHATDVNFTGPLITPNPTALSPHALLLEPYLVYAETTGSYDGQGHHHDTPYGAHQWQLLLPMSFGIIDRLTGHLSVGTAHKAAAGQHSDGWRATDTTAKLQYMVLAPNADKTTPSLSVAVAHRFATGAYDRLDANPLNGTGSGAARNRLSVYAQQYFWLANGRPLRWRVLGAWSPEPSRANLTGMSVYDTPPSFHGYVQLGTSASISSSLEYSIDRHWVLVMEAAWDRENQAHLRGWQCIRGAACVAVNRDSPANWVYSVAPAIEYNFSGSMGLIAGAQASVAGHHNGAFLNPQVALNMVF